MIVEQDIGVQMRRAEAALDRAAETVMHLREMLAPEDGRTERGVWFPVMRTPLRTEVADDADSIYAQLVNWVEYWAGELGMPAPSTARVWSNLREVQGFRAGTTPEGAAMLVRVLVVWLKLRAPRIEAHPAGEVFADDVRRLVNERRAKYRLTPETERLVSPRPCPVCKQFQVGATWQSDEVTDVIVSCGHCGHVVELPSVGELRRWVGPDPRTVGHSCVVCGRDVFWGEGEVPVTSEFRSFAHVECVVENGEIDG